MSSVPERPVDGRRPRRRPGKIISFVMDGDEYEVLAERGREQDRDPFQQARWMLRCALGLVPSVELPPVASDGPSDEAAS